MLSKDDIVMTNSNNYESEYESINHRRDLEMAREQRLMPAPSCLKCAHFKVCVIARNVFPMMDQMFAMLKDNDKPFKAEEIAKLCKWYEVQKQDE